MMMALALARILREYSYCDAQSDATVAVLVLPCATILYIVFPRARLRAATWHTVLCLS